MASIGAQVRAAADHAGATVKVVMTLGDAQEKVHQLCVAAPKNASVTVTGPAAHGMDLMKDRLSRVRSDITSCFARTPREGQCPVVANIATSITNVVILKFTFPDGNVLERKFVVYIH